MSMSRRRIPLTAAALATAAMGVAVPAFALSSHEVRHCNAVTVVSHKHRVRACLLRGLTGPRGPGGVRGPQGLRGPIGPTGLRGLTGTRGLTGPEGPTGTATAYAVVQPTATGKLIMAQTSKINSVTEPKPGIYCLVPAAGINPASDPATVSPEVSYSTNEAPGIIAFNAQAKDCPTGDFEVETFAPGTTPTLSGEYAFSILVA